MFSMLELICISTSNFSVCVLFRVFCYKIVFTLCTLVVQVALFVKL